MRTSLSASRAAAATGTSGRVKPRKAQEAAPGTAGGAARGTDGIDPALLAEGNEPTYVGKLALAARDNRSHSGWSVMVKYADKLAEEEDRKKRAARAREQEAQRRALDRQMEEARRREEAEAAELEKEAQMVLRQAADHRAKEEEERRAELEKGRRMREERARMMEEVERQRALASARKKAEEDRAIKAAQAAVEEERRLKHEAMLARKAEMARTREANEANLRRKKEELERLKEEDAEKMRQYIAFLEQQEREREEKLQSFFDSISKRAAAAGEMAVKENAERAAREDEVLRQQWDEAERRAQKKEEEDRARQQAINDELARVRKMQMDIKEEQRQRTADDMRRFVETVRQADQDAVQAERDRAQARRDRNVRYRRMLEEQIREREGREVLEPSVMTVQEAKLNEPILAGATQVLGREAINFETITSRPDIRYTTLGRFVP